MPVKVFSTAVCLFSVSRLICSKNISRSSSSLLQMGGMYEFMKCSDLWNRSNVWNAGVYAWIYRIDGTCVDAWVYAMYGWMY